MRVIKDKRFGEERALYLLRNAAVEHCLVAGEEDGESFLKECANVHVKDCRMDLRYPMWHAENLTVEDCELTENCRAALWYDEDLRIKNTRMNGIKAVRECKNILLEDSAARSPEFGWKCRNFTVLRSEVESEYAFLECRDLRFSDSKLCGKYSFQYCENVSAERSRFLTKDAFWHAKNVTLRDCTVDGEYLGWYSDGLTLIGCHIRGTQPLCYCKNLRLVDCTTENCDLAFEYSDVDASVRGEILSVKNPRRGRIVADGYGEIIREGGKYPVEAEIIVRNKE